MASLKKKKKQFYFIIEKQNEAIGRFTIDFGSNEVRLIDLVLILEARGKGYGQGIINALKLAARQVCVPLTLSVASTNLQAKRFYLNMGFRVEESQPLFDRLAWYPFAENMNEIA